jgi:hypothetical protein
MPEKDYSGTPLWKKLGLKPGLRFHVSSAPYPPVRAKIHSVLKEFPPVARPHEADVRLFFTSSSERLRLQFAAMTAAMKPDGCLWIAWPKKSSKLNTELKNDLAFEDVQRIGLDVGLVDNKSCSIDADWQALRFVVRKEDRADWPEILKRPTTG